MLTKENIYLNIFFIFCLYKIFISTLYPHKEGREFKPRVLGFFMYRYYLMNIFFQHRFYPNEMVLVSLFHVKKPSNLI